ncbi:MAG: hypothetical protein D4R79_08320 [Comamonadaceae bacterium]|nr:MAG: hypothetical protein D4R79_08320 [Comamonadaceae bacterium]
MKNTPRILTIALLFLSLSGQTAAATLEGQEFDDTIRLSNRELRLNGLGVRKMFFIKAYVAALYLGDRVGSSLEVALMPGPKRLQLRMLQNAGPDDFTSALVTGIRKNTSDAELVRLGDRIAQLQRTINRIGRTVKGDNITLDYLPESGTRLAVNGVSQGQAIAGADFFDALLGIFAGDRPVDSMLKKGLLGQ